MFEEADARLLHSPKWRSKCFCFKMMTKINCDFQKICETIAIIKKYGSQKSWRAHCMATLRLYFAHLDTLFIHPLSLCALIMLRAIRDATEVCFWANTARKMTTVRKCIDVWCSVMTTSSTVLTTFLIEYQSTLSVCVKKFCFTVYQRILNAPNNDGRNNFLWFVIFWKCNPNNVFNHVKIL